MFGDMGQHPHNHQERSEDSTACRPCDQGKPSRPGECGPQWLYESWCMACTILVCSAVLDLEQYYDHYKCRTDPEIGDCRIGLAGIHTENLASCVAYVFSAQLMSVTRT